MKRWANDAHGVEHLGRAGPGRHDEAVDPGGLPGRHVVLAGARTPDHVPRTAPRAGPLLARCPERRHHGGGGLGRVAHADPAVAQPTGPAQGAAPTRPPMRIGMGPGAAWARTPPRRSGNAARRGRRSPRSTGGGTPRWPRRNGPLGSPGSIPSARHSDSSQPGPGTDDGAAAGEPVQRGEGPGGDEGMAQAQEVDVGPEPDGRRAGRQEGQHGRGVEELRGGRNGRVLGPGEGRTGHGHGQHEVLGQPDRVETQTVGRLGRVGPDAGVHASEGHGEFHVGSPGTGLKLATGGRRWPARSNMLQIR